jgi:CRP/FNR family cyclic AMP-dependent transcriptional regulator
VTRSAAPKRPVRQTSDRSRATSASRPRAEAGTAAQAAPETRNGSGVEADWIPVLQGVPLFAELSSRQLQRVASVARLRRFSAGAAVVEMGDVGNAFYVILEGTALVVRPTGRPLKLCAGDFFGEMALLDDEPRSADVIAGEDMLAMTIGRAAFTKLLRSEPQLTHALLRTVAGRLRAAQGHPA